MLRSETARVPHQQSWWGLDSSSENARLLHPVPHATALPPVRPPPTPPRPAGGAGPRSHGCSGAAAQPVETNPSTPPAPAGAAESAAGARIPSRIPSAGILSRISPAPHPSYPVLFPRPIAPAPSNSLLATRHSLLSLPPAPHPATLPPHVSGARHDRRRRRISPHAAARVASRRTSHVDRRNPDRRLRLQCSGLGLPLLAGAQKTEQPPAANPAAERSLKADQPSISTARSPHGRRLAMARGGVGLSPRVKR